MLRFFRQIRKRLLTENRFSKYLLYAVGEILLVVIGILIALQVDTWNEDRIEKKAQQLSLNKLKEDLKYDILLFKRLDSTYFEWYNQASRMLNQLRTGSKERLAKDEFIIGEGSLKYVTLRTVTFDEMISTGLFYKIQNDKISDKIVDYYEFANFEIEKLNNDNRDFYSWKIQSPHQVETVNIAIRTGDQENLEFIDWSWLKDPHSPKYVYYEARLGFFKAALLENRRVLGELIERANKAVAAIDGINQ